MRYFGTDSDNMRLSGWEVVPPPRFNDGISEIWAEMQKRAKEGQEAKLNNQPVPDYEHMVYIFDSISVIMEWLSDRSRQQLVTLLCGLSIGYHMHFILLDSAEKSGVLMGPTYLQRSAPFVQGLILSHNPSAMMLFSQKEHHLLSDGEESLIITKDSALSGIVLTASREER